MRVYVPIALIAIVSASAAAGGTGRIAARLTAKPVDLSAEAAWTARVRLSADGHALTGVKAVLIARSGRRSRAFALHESRRRGLYSTRVVFPAAGRWTLAVRARARLLVLGSVRVGPHRPDVRGPFDVALAPNGWLAVADRGSGRVLLIDPRTGKARVAATGLDGPIAVAYDPSGSLYANSGEQIVRLQGGNPTVVAGTGTRGHTGDGGPAIAARLGGVGAFAFGAAGDLYLPETTTGSDTCVRTGSSRRSPEPDGRASAATAAPRDSRRSPRLTP
jgi:hypothetical protein